MSQEADLNLVELARKWGLRFLRYREVLLQLSLGMKPWWIDIMFYHYLLASGCTPIGKTSNAVYMRCSNRLAYFSRNYIDRYYYVRDIKALESEVKKIEKLRALTEEEVDKLRDRLTIVSVDFLDFIKFGLFGSEPINLLKLEDIDLFLASVNVTFSSDIEWTNLVL